MAPKTGPRGVTIEDVQGVADNGRAGYTITRRDTAPAIPTPSASDLAGLLVGGPQPGYGQKYGGLGSATNLNAAVKGNVYNFLAVQQALADRAAAAVAPVEQRLANAQRVAPNMYGAMPTTAERDLGRQLNDIKAQYALDLVRNANKPDTSLVNRPLHEWIAAGAGALKDIFFDRDFRNQTAVSPTYQLESRIQGTQELLDKARSDALKARIGGAQEYAKAAQERYGTEMAGVQPMQQLADTAGAITPSQFAQLVATQQYGVPAAVAAGQYGPGFEANIITEQARLASAQMPDFSKSDAQRVYEQYGPEGLAQYEANQAEKALGGTLEQQTAAAQAQQDIANIATDNGIYNSLGFTPAMVTTNKADADGIRQMIANNPEFAGTVQNAVASAMDRLTNGDALEDVQSEIIADYYNQTGDRMGAKYLADIVAYFGSSF